MNLSLHARSPHRGLGSIHGRDMSLLGSLVWDEEDLSQVSSWHEIKNKLLIPDHAYDIRRPHSD